MNIYIIGNGGIGSFLVAHIDKLIDINQISKDYKFTFFDDDKVETKNILYQNFSMSDIDSYKTDALSLKYFNVDFQTKRLIKKDLYNCDMIILCADNNEIRRYTYEIHQEKGTKFIDSRANGRAIGLFSSDTINYLSTLSEDNKSSSCQNPFQIQNKEIEYGNVIIASILAQAILNYTRTKKLPSDITLFI